MKNLLSLLLLVSPIVGLAQPLQSLAIRFGPSTLNKSSYEATSIDNEAFSEIYRSYGLEMEAMYSRSFKDKQRFTRYRGALRVSFDDGELSTNDQNNAMGKVTNTFVLGAIGLGHRFQWGVIGLSLGVDLEIGYLFPEKTSSSSFYLNAQSDTVREYRMIREPAKLSTGLTPFVNVNFEVIKRLHIGAEFRHPLAVFFINGTKEFSQQRIASDGTFLEDFASTTQIRLTQFITPQFMLPPLIEISYQW